MKTIVLFFFACLVFGQEHPEFKVKIDTIPFSELKELVKKNDIVTKGYYHEEKFLYEDEDYFVTETCKGEFGGNIYFKDKSDNLVYIGSS